MSFYTKPALRYFGRYYLTLLLAIFPFVFTYLIIYVWMQNGFRIYYLAIIPMFYIAFLCLNQLWEKLFAKLIVKNDRIIWRCIFRRSHTLLLTESRWIGVELEDSFNGLDYPFIYFSKEPYPAEFQHKINKLKCSDSFIKFWYSEQLVNYLETHVSANRVGALIAYREKCKREARVKTKKKNGDKKRDPAGYIPVGSLLNPVGVLNGRNK